MILARLSIKNSATIFRFQATGGAVIGAPTILWNPCQDTTLSGKTGCDSTANSGEV